jgi:hypothetical protein
LHGVLHKDILLNIPKMKQKYVTVLDCPAMAEPELVAVADREAV